MFALMISKEVPYSSITSLSIRKVLARKCLSVRKVETTGCSTLLGMREGVILICIGISSCFPKR